MSKHKLKDNFQIPTNDCVVVQNKVFIEDGVLYLVDNKNALKCENGEWFIKTPLTNDLYIPLGLGALPTYFIEDVTNISNPDAFNLLFEVCNETN